MPKETKPKRPSKWKPAPAALAELFETAVQDSLPGAQLRKMFGYPAAFVHGHMFTGLFQESMFVRLSADDLAVFLQLRGARPFEPMPGRAMREYAVVPDAVLQSSRQLRTWLERAFAYARSLPPKPAKRGR